MDPSTPLLSSNSRMIIIVHYEFSNCPIGIVYHLFVWGILHPFDGLNDALLFSYLSINKNYSQLTFFSAQTIILVQLNSTYFRIFKSLHFCCSFNIELMKGTYYCI